MAGMDSGNRILAARRGAKLSREAVAAALGVSGATIRNWEAGETEPRLSDIEGLARVTGRPLSFFFDPDSTIPHSTGGRRGE